MGLAHTGSRLGQRLSSVWAGEGWGRSREARSQTDHILDGMSARPFVRHGFFCVKCAPPSQSDTGTIKAEETFMLKVIQAGVEP